MNEELNIQSELPASLAAEVTSIQKDEATIRLAEKEVARRRANVAAQIREWFAQN